MAYCLPGELNRSMVASRLPGKQSTRVNPWNYQASFTGSCQLFSKSESM